MAKFSNKEQIHFTKRLGFLMRAGTPIMESFHILQKQASKKAMHEVYGKIISGISAGQSLWQSLENSGNYFSEFSITLIKVGESSGTLIENLDYLAEELKKKEQLKHKILGSMFYPLFIITVTIGLTTSLIVFVFPKIIPIFSSVNISLPWTTRFLLHLSSFLIHHGFVVVGMGVLLIVGIKAAWKSRTMRLWIQNSFMKVPLIKNLLQHFYMANTCRTLGLLLKGHSALDRALIITSSTIENLVYKNAFLEISKEIQAGRKVSHYFLNHRELFPDIVCHLIGVGETAGNLAEVFLYLANLYETEIDELTKNLSGMLEPILMVSMGLLVGFVAVSIITPIYAITQKLHP